MLVFPFCCNVAYISLNSTFFFLAIYILMAYDILIIWYIIRFESETLTLVTLNLAQHSCSDL